MRALGTKTAARSLLTYAFGAEVIARIPVPALLARLEKTVRAQLDQATHRRRC